MCHRLLALGVFLSIPKYATAAEGKCSAGGDSLVQTRRVRARSDDDFALLEDDSPEIHAPTYFSGGTDGSCPTGTSRVGQAECETLGGGLIFEGQLAGKIAGQWMHQKCKDWSLPGMGCFHNGKDVFSTPSECSRAGRKQDERNFAICKDDSPDVEPIPCLTISNANHLIDGQYDYVGQFAGRPKYCHMNSSLVLSWHGTCSGWMSICKATDCVPHSCACKTRNGGVPLDENGNPREKANDAIFLWPAWGGTLTQHCEAGSSMPAEGDYSMAAEGDTACPTGYSAVSDGASCETASLKLGGGNYGAWGGNAGCCVHRTNDEDFYMSSACDVGHHPSHPHHLVCQKHDYSMATGIAKGSAL